MTKEKRETDDVAIDGYMGPELKKEIIKEIQNRIQDPTRRSSCFIYEESILDVNLSTQSLVVSLLTNMNLNSKPTLVCIKLTPNQERVEVAVSTKMRDFAAIVKQVEQNNIRLRPVASQTERISPTNHKIAKNTTKNETVNEYFMRLSKPHRDFFQRYAENWTNGKHLGVIERVSMTLLSGYPLQLLYKGGLKLQALHERITKNKNK